MAPLPRIHLPQPFSAAQRVVLPPHLHHYLTRVLRLGAGAPLVLFNGEGGEWGARLVDPSPPGVVVLERFQPVDREPPVAVTVVHGLAKSNAMELAVQKWAELGGTTYIPLVTRRSVPRPQRGEGEKKLERLRRIAVEAAEQCGRTRVPRLLAPVGWGELEGVLPEGPRLICWERTEGIPPLRQVLATLGNPTRLTLLIGPEGGLEADEVWEAQDRLGFQPVALGPRILRTETALLAALTAVLTLIGDLT